MIEYQYRGLPHAHMVFRSDNAFPPRWSSSREKNDCDFDSSCGIQQRELDSAAATEQQIDSDENRNAIPRVIQYFWIISNGGFIIGIINVYFVSGLGRKPIFTNIVLKNQRRSYCGSLAISSP
jgi:hypothetical protein